MNNIDILFLSLIIFFCISSVVALVFNAYSKSRVPLAIFVASGVLVVAFSVFLLLNRDEASPKYVRDYIPVTEYSKTEARGGAERKTQNVKTTAAPADDEKSDDDIVYITKHGTKYHFSLDCGEYEFYECTLRQAKERGLEPCQNCAQ